MRKFLFPLSIFTVATGLLLFGQTKVTPQNIGSGGASGTKVMVLGSDGKVYFAQLSGLSVDMTTNPPTLIASSQTNTAVDVSVLTASGGNTFTLSHTPVGSLEMISRNGIVLSENVDYTVAGNVVTFAANVPLLNAGDVIRARYNY